MAESKTEKDRTPCPLTDMGLPHEGPHWWLSRDEHRIRKNCLGLDKYLSDKTLSPPPASSTQPTATNQEAGA